MKRTNKQTAHYTMISMIIALAIAMSIILFACTPVKNNCGTNKQHKARFEKTKKMAPLMSR